MLPSSYPENEPYKIIWDDRDGFHVALVKSQPAPAASRPRPLFVLVCQDRQSMESLVAWFAVRRSLWPTWGKTAEFLGNDAIGNTINQMMANEPVGSVQASIVQADEDPCVLNLGQMLECGSGHRSEMLYQHRFSSAEERTRFFDWFDRNTATGEVDKLIDLGIKEGTDALAEKLNRLAEHRASLVD